MGRWKWGDARGPQEKRRAFAGGVKRDRADRRRDGLGGAAAVRYAQPKPEPIGPVGGDQFSSMLWVLSPAFNSTAKPDWAGSAYLSGILNHFAGSACGGGA